MPKSSVKKIVEELKKSDRYIRIEESLMEQLECNKNDIEYNKDLISDYMDLWVTKCLLIDDINKRGVTVIYQNGKNQKGKKKNESVTELAKINMQMLRLLDGLGLKPTNTFNDMGVIDADDKL